MGIATPEGSTIEIDGEEVPVSFDGPKVIVNGESVPQATPVSGVVTGEIPLGAAVSSSTSMSISDVVSRALGELIEDEKWDDALKMVSQRGSIEDAMMLLSS